MYIHVCDILRIIRILRIRFGNKQHVEDILVNERTGYSEWSCQRYRRMTVLTYLSASARKDDNMLTMAPSATDMVDKDEAACETPSAGCRQDFLSARPLRPRTR